MKFKIFVLQGMADEPLSELGGRTPLESAKTPVLDRLALSGSIGTASFVPRSLEPEPWVALFSVLGYDPQEFYTGPGPLEALGAGLDPTDREVVFLCDFVSQLDNALVDPAAGHISDREAKQLLKDVEKKVHDKRARFKAIHGYRNLLFIEDAQLIEDLDDTPTLAPEKLVGQDLRKRRLQGKAAEFLYAISESAAECLESHEINRVRVDLGENPANRIWLWGQGRTPKLPPFAGRAQREGALAAAPLFARGIGRAAQMRVEKSADKIQDVPVQVIYVEMNAAHSTEPLKVKVRSIEKFDQLVGRELESSPSDTRVLVTTDVFYSLASRSAKYDAVPFLMSGPGVAAGNKDKFTEKNCALSSRVFEKGHKLLEEFFK